MRRVLLLLVAAALLLPRGAFAQSSCAAALAQAQKAYDGGDFSGAVLALGECQRTRLPRQTAIEVQSLLAHALIYDERTDEARAAVSKLLRLEPAFDPGPPSRFAELVQQVKREEQTTQVTSVSKTNESLREAPATVVVVTGDEIERRGYLDLEQLLHNLPGFDVSRTNGDIYSHIYQRGYYDEFNTRLLLLVDGVEQNDLTQGSEYLSRQYPLTNIDRVEVIYGPASTMYGANAYTGVISVITKDVATLIGENKRFGAAGHITSGGYGSRAIDFTTAGADSGGNVAWSVAGRFQDGKERDLSALDTWDFTYRNKNYAALSTLKNVDAAGLELARQTDRSFVQDNGLGFDDRAKNWGVNAKVQISNLTFGLQSWRSEEGVASAYGASTFSGNSSYTPEETALYIRYATRLSSGTLNVFTRYMQSSLDEKESSFDAMSLYANGALDSRALFPRCSASVCPPKSGSIVRISGRALSTQIRNEINMTWQPTETLSGVTGVEFVKSHIQSHDDTFADGFLAIPSPSNYHTDAALWAQGSWKPRKSLRVTVAGRATHNEINNSEERDVSGFGFLFTPRVAVVYTPTNRLALKAIYSEAFKDPTDTEKFGGYVFPRQEYQSVLNVDLRPERVRNVEVSAGWEAAERTAIQLSAYQAHYHGVVALATLPPKSGCPAPCRQNQNRDEVRVRGVEATARHKIFGAEVWANFTHTQPVQSVPSPSNPAERQIVRVANIAENQVNLGVDAEWRRLSAGIRTHYSGRRKIGRGTSFITKPDLLGTEVDAYSTTAVSLAYRDLLPKMTLQLLLDNVLDEQYYAVGSELLPRVLQNGRTVNLRLIYRMK